MSTRIFLSCAIALCTLVSNQAHAAGYVGGLVGMIKPDLEQNTEAKLGFGLRAGAMVGDEYSIGGYLQRWAKSEGGLDMSLTPILFDLNFYMDGMAGPYFGGRLGFVQESIKLGTVTVTETETGAGIQGGYNFPMSDAFTLGMEASLIHVFGDPKEYNLLNFMGTATFWF